MTAEPSVGEPPVPPGLRDGPVYLDYNSTTPVDPRVVEAALPYLTTHFGNPSSGHRYAVRPGEALARARGQVAALIGAAPEEIVFTGSGSEADALAIIGAVPSRRRPDEAHVITQATEHPAVLEACRALRRRHGPRVTVLPVDAHGRVDPADLAAALDPDTTLVSIMAANNETGVLQPIAELAAITRRHGALFHTDAAQAAGKIPLDVTRLGVDLLTLAGHKFYAPKGVGALYVRSGVRLEPLVPGGGQERGLRAGTENVALTVALGVAADLARSDLADGGPDRQARLRNRLHRRLAELLPGRVALTGEAAPRLPGTLHITIGGARGDDVLAATPTVAAATGSACHTGSPEPSPVLLAMGLARDGALSALRLGVGRWTTPADVDRAAEALAATVRAV
ncbi:cysteine desulfurase [Actinomadura pelletieri DSM 43383]|uniref:cysteine desulfurase n=1 Tax=Actinomadura pelletieri DSM 43383 TaxID=1120940 RepID=A0A495QY29_9ACTN|nr:cysteine desulfurase family protein [Actinomadura pelletieri]RKS78924.1 cysteine desulfurase [Actinomadura pelletieri DSM 43383]